MKKSERDKLRKMVLLMPSYEGSSNFAYEYDINILLDSYERLVEALKFYAQEPQNDFRKNEWNDSCREWGLEPTTWEPLFGHLTKDGPRSQTFWVMLRRINESEKQRQAS